MPTLRPRAPRLQRIRAATRQPRTKPLSNELKQNEGVLEPPKSLDNEIVREAPVPEPNTTPVIPPPGAPGGDPNVKPK